MDSRLNLVELGSPSLHRLYDKKIVISNLKTEKQKQTRYQKFYKVACALL